MGTLHLRWQPPSPKCQQTQPSWASLIFGILVIIYVGIGTCIFYNTVCGIATVNTAELGKFDMFISICFGGILVFKVIGIGWNTLYNTVRGIETVDEQENNLQRRNYRQCLPTWEWLMVSGLVNIKTILTFNILKNSYIQSPSANVSLSTVFS